VTLVEGASQARFLPPDRLVYARGGDLFAVAFDSRTLEVSGSPTTVLRDVATDVNAGAVQFALSEERSLLWAPGSLTTWQRRIERFAPTLEPLQVPLEPGRYAQIAVSPDGTQLALTILGEQRSTDLWIADLKRGTMTRRTFDSQVANPVWTPDGSIWTTRGSATDTGESRLHLTTGWNPR
jgi:hypothetical protein